MTIPRAAVTVIAIGVICCVVDESGCIVWAEIAPLHESGGESDEARPDGWFVQYRFVGDPKERVYQEFHDVGPEGEKFPYAEKVILVRVLRVLEGHPPVDEEGFYRYRSLTAAVEVWPFPLRPGWPWKRLKYEFTGLKRIGPQTGEDQVRVNVEPLWWSSFWQWVLGGSVVLVVGILLGGFAVRRVLARLRRNEDP